MFIASEPIAVDSGNQVLCTKRAIQHRPFARNAAESTRILFFQEEMLSLLRWVMFLSACMSSFRCQSERQSLTRRPDHEAAAAFSASSLATWSVCDSALCQYALEPSPDAEAGVMLHGLTMRPFLRSKDAFSIDHVNVGGDQLPLRTFLAQLV